MRDLENQNSRDRLKNSDRDYYSNYQLQAKQPEYEDEAEASRLIFSLFVAVLTGLGLGVYFFLTTQNQTPAVKSGNMSSTPARSLQQ